MKKAKNIFSVQLCLILASLTFSVHCLAQTNSIDWRYGRPGVRVVTNAVTEAQVNELLGNKVDVTDGVATNLTLGTYAKFANDYTATGSEDVGSLLRNDATGDLEYVIDSDGNITIGEELYRRLVNLSGGTVSDGTLVSITGASGNRSGFSCTDIRTKANALSCVGLVTVETIDNNLTGRITTKGPVRGLDTSSLTEGSPVYASLPCGTLSATQPASSNYVVRVGTCAVKHAVNGIIDVDIVAYPKMHDLSGVNGTELDTTGQIFVYDSVNRHFDANYNINNYGTLTQVNANSVTGGLNTAAIAALETYNTTNRTVRVYDNNNSNIYYEGLNGVWQAWQNATEPIVSWVVIATDREDGEELTGQGVWNNEHTEVGGYTYYDNSTYGVETLVFSAVEETGITSVSLAIGGDTYTLAVYDGSDTITVTDATTYITLQKSSVYATTLLYRFATTSQISNRPTFTQTTNIVDAAITEVAGDVDVLQTQRVERLWSSTTNYMDGNGIMYEIAPVIEYVSPTWTGEQDLLLSTEPGSPNEIQLRFRNSYSYGNYGAWGLTSMDRTIIDGDMFVFNEQPLGNEQFNSFNCAFGGWAGLDEPLIDSYGYQTADIAAIDLFFSSSPNTIINEYGVGGFVGSTFVASDGNLWTFSVYGEYQTTGYTTNIIDRVVTTNGTIILTGSTADASGSTTQLTARAGSSTLNLPFYGRAEAEAALADIETQSEANSVTGALNTAAIAAIPSYWSRTGTTLNPATATDNLNIDSGTLYVKSSANQVGIGSASPTSTLYIRKDSSSTNWDNDSNAIFSINNLNATVNNFASFWFRGSTVPGPKDYSAGFGAQFIRNATHGGADLWFATRNYTDSTMTRKMVIKSRGDVEFDTDTLYVDAINNRVGVGTTSPAVELDVDGDFIADSIQGAHKSSDGTAGWTGTFTNGDGATVTVKDGLITAVTAP